MNKKLHCSIYFTLAVLVLIFAVLIYVYITYNCIPSSCTKAVSTFLGPDITCTADCGGGYKYLPIVFLLAITDLFFWYKGIKILRKKDDLQNKEELLDKSDQV